MKQELLVTAILFILLFLKLGSKEWKAESLLNLINVLLLLNVIAGFFAGAEGKLFGEMFRTNALITLEKNILNLGVLIISLQSYSWLSNHKHIAEFYMLLLATLLGMFFMISSNNILMFYLGLELSSIPLAAMCNFDLEKRISSEAAFKFIMSSGFSSGLLLFGISMLYGTTGSLNFPEISQHLNGNPLEIFSFILLVAGFGFKISAVPFAHDGIAYPTVSAAPVKLPSRIKFLRDKFLSVVFIDLIFNLWEHLPSSVQRFLLPCVCGDMCRNDIYFPS
jgi:NADH-quinone oxidoreductase subunit N